MADRPIIFSAAMVRAILAGRKTQTRRIVRLPKWATEIDEIGDDGHTMWCVARDSGCLSPALPQYRPGDTLWVREMCRAEELPDGRDGVRYEADQTWREIENTREASDAWLALYHYGKKRGKRVPSIHMPRWASRITLRVTAVRVERLHDISEEDAKAAREARPAFARLWDGIHGRGAWDANPWVVVIGFERVS